MFRRGRGRGFSDRDGGGGEDGGGFREDGQGFVGESRDRDYYRQLFGRGSRQSRDHEQGFRGGSQEDGQVFVGYGRGGRGGRRRFLEDEEGVREGVQEVGDGEGFRGASRRDEEGFREQFRADGEGFRRGGEGFRGGGRSRGGFRSDDNPNSSYRGGRGGRGRGREIVQTDDGPERRFLTFTLHDVSEPTPSGQPNVVRTYLPTVDPGPPLAGSRRAAQQYDVPFVLMENSSTEQATSSPFGLEDGSNDSPRNEQGGFRAKVGHEVVVSSQLLNWKVAMLDPLEHSNVDIDGRPFDTNDPTVVNILREYGRGGRGIGPRRPQQRKFPSQGKGQVAPVRKFYLDYKTRHEQIQLYLTNHYYGTDGSASPRIFALKNIQNQSSEEVQAFMAILNKYSMTKELDKSNLAIMQSRETILAGIQDYQVYVVEGFTGCGKTTQVPQFILNEHYDTQIPCRILVTQPRRIAAQSVANRVCHERGWTLGGLVGYQVGMDKKVTEDTVLTYMTTGVLLQTLINKRDLSRWTHILIDEVHERDLETDLLLLVIKKILLEDTECTTRIILMSATLNADKFLEYYKVFNDNPYLPEEQPAVHKIPNESRHQIHEHYADDVTADKGLYEHQWDRCDDPKLQNYLMDLACRVIFEFDKSEKSGVHDDREGCVDNLPKPRGAVLVFLPGLLEIDSMLKMLRDFSKLQGQILDLNDPCKYLVLPLHSTITSEEQNRVFKPAQPGYRKIILATNIAESSITVTDIKYVIDFCLTKSLGCDTKTNYTCLRLEWASKNQCIQRRGRCGRVSDGHCYRMVTKAFYEGLCEEALPEMTKASLESVVLSVKMLDMDSPKNVLKMALDPPNTAGIYRAVSNLKEVGALVVCDTGDDPCDGVLTNLGRVLSRLPIDIRLGRLIMLGFVYGCLEETIIIAAGLSVKSPFSSPYERRMESYLSKLQWSNQSFSDCFAIIHVYKVWRAKITKKVFVSWRDEREWARKYFLQFNSLKEMHLLVEEIKRRLNMERIGYDFENVPSQSGIGQASGVVELEAEFINDRTQSIDLSQEQSLILKIVIAGAFYPNYFIRARPNQHEYNRKIFKEASGENPFRTVVFGGFPLDQPGELYMKHVADYFTHDAIIPKVRVEVAKAIVQFDNRGMKIGAISMGVFRGMKMKQLRNCNVVFQAASRDESEDFLVKAQQKEQEEKERGQSRGFDMINCPTPSTMPGLTNSSFQATMLHIKNPSEFWVMPVGNAGILYNVNSILHNVHASSLTEAVPNRIHPRLLFLVQYRGQLHRARIETVSSRERKAMVHLIDHGNCLWVGFHQLYCLTARMCQRGLHEMHPVALQCRLAGIGPSFRNGFVWHEDAKKSLKHLIENSGNTSCLVEIFSIVKGVINCDLHIRFQDGRDVSAVNMLLCDELADEVPETKEANADNLIRQKYCNSRNAEMDERATNAIKLEQWDDEPQKCYEPPDNDLFYSENILKGPYNPLEMTFNSLCKSAHFKQVVVEGNSVNCVALDDSPQPATSRCLISATVGVTQRTGNLLARDTTILPAINGLVSLVTMLFCPKMELRVDTEGSKYIGLLSGLGVDENGKAIFEDRDVEIAFDTVIDNTDIGRINDIRILMNCILSMSFHGCNSYVQRMQKTVRKRLIRLLERPREQTEEFWHDFAHRWGIISDLKGPENDSYKSNTYSKRIFLNDDDGSHDSNVTVLMPDDVVQVFPPHRRVDFQWLAAKMRQGPQDQRVNS